jgi:hypothetical protein
MYQNVLNRCIIGNPRLMASNGVKGGITNIVNKKINCRLLQTLEQRQVYNTHSTDYRSLHRASNKALNRSWEKEILKSSRLKPGDICTLLFVFTAPSVN